MGVHEARDILSQVAYRDWTFHVGDGYLQVQFSAAANPLDPASPAAVMHGRKFLLSAFMTRSELIQTALLAVLQAEEHEARERFLYRGRPVFGPHFDVEKLVELCDSPNCLDARA